MEFLNLMALFVCVHACVCVCMHVCVCLVGFVDVYVHACVHVCVCFFLFVFLFLKAEERKGCGVE